MSLSLDQVSFRVGRAALLSDVSMTLGASELVAVVGPNGAGKTTLLRILAGDIRPSAGSVSLDGRPLATWSAAALARRRAVMRTDSSVAFGFTAREVALMGRLPIHAGDPDAADRQLVDGLLAAVHCSALSERAFATLSNGERQRVGLARAIAQVRDDAGSRQGETAAAERFLLLDEPTSSLDPAHQHTAMRLLRDEVEGGRGALVVLHDLNLAAAYADRILLMKEGRIVAAGSPHQMLQPPLLELVFEIPMLVVQHPGASHPLVVSQPQDGQP